MTGNTIAVQGLRFRPQDISSRIFSVRRRFVLFVWFFLMILVPVSASGGEWGPLMERLAQDGFSRQSLDRLFERPEVRFDPSIMATKIKTLYETKFGAESVRKLQKRLAFLGYEPGGADGKTGPRTSQAIRWFQKAHGLPVDGRPSPELLQIALEDKSKAPANVSPPPPRKGPLVYETIMTEERLEEARAFFAENRDLLLLLEKRYKIHGEIAVGILTVETRLGSYLGDEKALVTLASMASCDDFRCVAEAFKDEPITRTKRRWIEKRIAQKARWAYHECKSLLLYAQRSGKDPLSIPGSLYGAIGIAQFMPSQAIRYGVDGNQDGVVDLFDLEDALFSMGNYLKANGWRGQMNNVRKQRRAIYNYNHSIIYVNTVMAVADYLKQG
jgi:membrane-bound lytic murein transglycosylase B